MDIYGFYQKVVLIETLWNPQLEVIGSLIGTSSYSPRNVYQKYRTT
jgi:hypothetical protein